MLVRFRQRQEVQFLGAIVRAAPAVGTLWLVLIVVRGALPAIVSAALGWLISSIQSGGSSAGALTLLGGAFGLSLVMHPIHQAVSAAAGSRLAASLYSGLTDACLSPVGIAPLEDTELAGDLVMARDFDLGMHGPPLDLSMDFVAGGLVEMMVGVCAAVLLAWFNWWAAIILVVGWGATHWLLRESGVWKDRNTDAVRTAQRHAEYSYRLAVEASPAKEIRLFGLAGWVIDRFVTTRTRLYELQFEATRLREKSVMACLAIVAVANAVVFWVIAASARRGDLSVADVVVYANAAVGVSAIAFGGLNWALDGASAPVAALARFRSGVRATADVADSGKRRLAEPGVDTIDAPSLSFDRVGFSYPSRAAHHGPPVLRDMSFDVAAGTSLAIVGVNGAGKTTLAKLICRLYQPDNGVIRANGIALDEIPVGEWRSLVTAVFQDYVRFELSLRDNVAPIGAPDELIRSSLVAAGAEHLADGNLDTVLSKGYPGGTDLSGGQWQRVALARAICAVGQGARVVLLDEPTAQLDVRGEAEIFERLLAATRHCTTVLISHRFSTVRLADRIAVVEHGAVVECGTHDELMAANGRYRTMFDLQASRFVELDDDGEEVVYEAL